MENAVEALKIAFAVFVFAIAVALSFSVVGQVRATSDVILALEDKTNAYDYVENSESNANNKERIVGFETILPAIYRYAEEQYAVTIVDTNGQAIARFDLYTEGFMNNWDEVLRLQNSSNNTIKTNAQNTIESVKGRLAIVESYIKGKNVGELQDTDRFIYNNLKTLYKVNNNQYGAPWVGGQDQKDKILKRIKSDLDGTEYIINNITYQGKKLNEKCKDKKFKEKFIEIQTSGTTITDTDENGNVEYSLETVKGNKKLEIVYIMQ